jgi:ligand-binding SRPBCC domain-containing protein
LPSFKHHFTVQAKIGIVWDFYTDIKHLNIITPTYMNFKITNATTRKIIQGQEIWASAKMFKKTTIWHSRITYVKPYEYADEMLTGPFNRWRHVHKFYDIDGTQTEVTDEIDFKLPYGILGKLFESYVYIQLQKIFEHRKVSTIKVLECI